MSPIVLSALLLPTAALVAAGCLPEPVATRHIRGFRRCITALSAVQFAIASFLAIALGMGRLPPKLYPLLDFSPELPVSISLYIDGVSLLMLTLVAFVGWVILRFSLRYLDGEHGQGRYYRWTSLTLGAVCVMVVSGNLVMFIAAWVTTSLGLHQLLLHYSDRPAAKRAAWTKFTISRIGDAALIAASVLIYRQFGTLDFPELFARLGGLHSATAMTSAAGFLLVIGAITKSAQFPFHTWLPLTMETPTPVSALMHAGVVNAGGYLMIRTSPLLSHTPGAMTLLAIVGGWTACFAAVVMLTQTSVKKSLAYSTIAQMGFMLLQCGLGAYSAAMLHIIAHSLYKAHAFLSSGSVLSGTAAMGEGRTEIRASRGSIATTMLAAIASLTLLGASFAIFGINPINKPGGLLLGGALSLALTHWIGGVFRTGESKLFTQSLAVGGGLCLAYAASYSAVNFFVSASVPAAAMPVGWVGVTAIIATGFLGLFLLQGQLSQNHHAAWLDRWQIHAANGFYVESVLRRVFGPIASN